MICIAYVSCVLTYTVRCLLMICTSVQCLFLWCLLCCIVSKSFSRFTKASWVTIPQQPSHSTYPTRACIESVKHRNRNRHYSCYGNRFYGNHFFSDTSCVYTCDMLSPHLFCAYVCRSRSMRGIRSSYVTG